MEDNALDRKSFFDNTEAIDYILDLANNSDSPLLSRVRYHFDSSFPTYRLLLNFLCAQSTLTSHVDIPLKNLFGNFRPYYEHENESSITWLKILNDKIEGGANGKGWTQDDLEYLMGDLSGPMPSNSSLLKLESYAGITFPTCGNHRVIASYCLLAALYGQDAILKNAHVSFFPLIQNRFDLFKYDPLTFDEIYMSDSDKPRYEFLFINSAHTTWKKFEYNVNEEKYEDLELKENNFLNQKTFDLNPRKWWKIEKEMIEFIFNDTWFSEQIS